jgi:glycosyltransferase involved in cell wall biosynthesis
MRILFVAPWVPSAIRPRSLAFLQMLAGEHDVRFLALVHHAEEAHSAQRLPTAHRTLVPNPRVGSMVRSLHALCTGRSLQQGYASPRSLDTALRRELDEWQPDAVHLNVFRTAHLVEACGRTPVLIDLDEFRSEYYQQLADSGPSLVWRALGRVEARRMRSREDELVRMAVPIVLSAPLLNGSEPPNTFVVRSPCDFPLRELDGPPPPTVLFVGRLTYEANVHGLLWFLRECWPGIRAAVPDAILKIVGTVPPRLMRSLTGSGVEIFPNVPDVEPHYATAAVAIAPIFRGTGIQMKLIQSLSAGVPTVTTHAVASRAGVKDGVHVRVADDATGWTAAVCELLDQPTAAARLAAAGRDWVVAHHSSAAVRRQLDHVYASMWGGTREPGPVSGPETAAAGAAGTRRNSGPDRP